MFAQVQVARWQLLMDHDATFKANQSESVSCDCGNCRNFLAAVDKLPQEFFQLMDTLGLDASRPTEIVSYNENADGSHFFGWWYHVVGKPTNLDELTKSQSKTTPVANGVEAFLSIRRDLAPTDFPEPVLQIEFFATLPWALKQPST